MRLSAQEEYGLRCLLQVGRQGRAASITIPEISRREGITVPHAAKTMQLLRHAGFVTSTRGQAGGYALALAPGKIVIRDVLVALGGRLIEEQFCPTQAAATRSCTHASGCSIRALWRRVQLAMDEVLAKTTLEDLLRNEPAMAAWLYQLPAPAYRPPANPTI